MNKLFIPKQRETAAAINDLDMHLIVDADRVIRERGIAETTAEQTAQDIANWEYEDVAFVWRINPTEGICRDVSQDIAEQALHIMVNSADDLDKVPDFIERHASDLLAKLRRELAQDMATERRHQRELTAAFQQR